MRPTKIGQVVKYHTPFPDENPNQLYVMLELYEDVEVPRGYMKPLNFPFHLETRVVLDDVEVVKVNASELIGRRLIVRKSDASKVQGVVMNVDEPYLFLDLKKGEEGAETNVLMTVKDDNGQFHDGTLFVDKNSRI